MEKREIVIEYYVNTQYWLDAYYAKNGVLDEEFAQNLNDSTAYNMRHFTIAFDNEKLVILNKDKNETNTFYYQDLYRINKTKIGYLFFINNQNFWFVSNQFFKSFEQQIINDLLQNYINKNQESEIALIKDYELDVNRLYNLNCYQQKSIIIFIRILTILTLFFLCYLKISDPTKSIYFPTGMLIMFLSLKPAIKIACKKFYDSSDEIWRRAKVTFYNDRLEMISKKKGVVNIIKYNQFYKIKREKKYYLFFTSNVNAYLFYKEEFTADQRETLEENLLQHNNYYPK